MITITISSDKAAEGKTTVADLISHALGTDGLAIRRTNIDGDANRPGIDDRILRILERGTVVHIVEEVSR